MQKQHHTFCVSGLSTLAHNWHIQNQPKDLSQNEVYQKGYQDAQRQYAQQVAHLEQELNHLQHNLMEHLKKSYQQLVQDFQACLPHLLLNLLEKVWAFLEWDEESVKSMVNQILMAYPPGETALEVYLSTDDYALFKTLNIDDQYTGVHFFEDPSFVRGDCLVKSRLGLLDARFQTKLKKAQQHMQPTNNHD